MKNNAVAMNSDQVLCGAFGLYPGYVAGILKHVEEINFYILCNDKLIYSDYIENSISDEKRNTSCVSCVESYFKLSSSGETLLLKFETRFMEENLPSVLTYVYYLINRTRLSSLVCDIVSVNRRVTCITNEVLASKHDCVLTESVSYLRSPRHVLCEGFGYLKTPKRQASYKIDSENC